MGAGSVAPAEPHCKAGGRGAGRTEVITVLAKFRDRHTTVRPQVLDHGADLNVQFHAVRQFLDLDFPTRLRREEGTPITGDRRQAARQPLPVDRGEVFPTQILQIADPVLATQLAQDEAKRGVDREVEVGRADGLSIGLREGDRGGNGHGERKVRRCALVREGRNDSRARPRHSGPR